MNDTRIPKGIDAAVRRAAAALPTQAWDLDSLTRRTAAGHRPWWRRHRVSRRMTGIVAGAVAAVAVGSAALVVGGPGRETPPADQTSLSWIFAVDRDHLYAVRPACDGCPEELLGSDDGGVTWTRRTDQTDRSFRLTVGPRGA